MRVCETRRTELTWGLENPGVRLGSQRGQRSLCTPHAGGCARRGRGRGLEQRAKGIYWGVVRSALDYEAAGRARLTRATRRGLPVRAGPRLLRASWACPPRRRLARRSWWRTLPLVSCPRRRRDDRADLRCACFDQSSHARWTNSLGPCHSAAHKQPARPRRTESWTSSTTLPRSVSCSRVHTQPAANAPAEGARDLHRKRAGTAATQLVHSVVYEHVLGQVRMSSASFISLRLIPHNV